MEEKNELNDIILNRGTKVTGNKKIVLVVATLGIILIIVVMLMNSLTSKGTDNLPQAVLPPEPQVMVSQQAQEEPLFEDVEVVQEDQQGTEDLDKITKRLKEESRSKIVTPKKVVTPVKKVHKVAKVTKKANPASVKISISSKSYFVQVGSFSRYKPDVKFLKSITDKGFKYQYYKVTKNAKTLNKVLIGPFDNEKDARNALRTIRSGIESGAFLIKI